MTVAGCRSFKPMKVDDRLTVFVSDLHVRDMGCYQYRFFDRTVDEILAMNPRPRRVIAFGDIAYTCGLEREYRTSRPMLERLIDAGMEVTLGMGNHDRRSTFLSVWPEYRGRTLLPGKIVTKTDLGPVDLLMLDGLQGKDERKNTDMGPVSGALDNEHQEWLLAYLKGMTKRTILASHFPVNELKVCGKPLASRFNEFPLIAGYIYGHLHRWIPSWNLKGWGSRGIVRTLCLPSTGHWGDIGYTVFRADEHMAQAEFVQKDFFFPRPAREDERRPPEWDDIIAERTGGRCVFRY